MIDLSELCIVEGRSAWVIFADCVCLDFDGFFFIFDKSTSVVSLCVVYTGIYYIYIIVCVKNALLFIFRQCV